jgi:hypothetical protein
MRIALLAGWIAVSMISIDVARAQAPTQEPPAKTDQTTKPTAPDAAPDKPAPAKPPGDTAPAAKPPREATTPPAAAPKRESVNRRRACRQEARRAGIRGPEAGDHMAICFAEARLECTKQSVGRGFTNRQRNAFIRECLGQGERRGRRGKRKGREK